jgi:hypothetical protein
MVTHLSCRAQGIQEEFLGITREKEVLPCFIWVCVLVAKDEVTESDEQGRKQCTAPLRQAWTPRMSVIALEMQWSCYT